MISVLAGEKLLQGSANLRHVHGSDRDLPHNAQIHVGIVMGDDIAHTAHFSKGEFRNGLVARLSYVHRGVTDDFNTPDDDLLFLLVGVNRFPWCF